MIADDFIVILRECLSLREQQLIISDLMNRDNYHFDMFWYVFWERIMKEK